MVYESKLANLLMQNSHKLFPFLSEFIQCILLLKQLCFSLPSSFPESIAKEERSNILLLHNLVDILMSAFVNHPSKHAKITVA